MRFYKNLLWKKNIKNPILKLTIKFLLLSLSSITVWIVNSTFLFSAATASRFQYVQVMNPAYFLILKNLFKKKKLFRRLFVNFRYFYTLLLVLWAILNILLIILFYFISLTYVPFLISNKFFKKSSQYRKERVASLFLCF